MTITVVATKLMNTRSKEDAACTSSNHPPSEKNLRSMLIRTISWRGFKKTGSCPEFIKEQQQNMSSQSITDASSGHLSLQRNAVFPPRKGTDSYHSFSSEESSAEDEKGFEWGDDEEDAKQSTNQAYNHEDDDDDDSIVLDSIQNNDDEDYNQNESLEQSLNGSRSQPIRNFERRRRRLSMTRSHGSSSGLSLGSSVCTYDESLDNISDSLDFGSSRHSVGRSGRRRTTQNRHLHQQSHHHHRHKQISVSTSSDPLGEFSNTSVLHKRLELNLKAHNQSQHSVSSSSSLRDNPRYIVVKAPDAAAAAGSGEDHVKDLQQIREARKKDLLAATTKTTTTTTRSSVEHPRFIVIQSKPKEEEGGEKDGKPHARRGRRRRVHTTEKTNQTV